MRGVMVIGVMQRERLETERKKKIMTKGGEAQSEIEARGKSSEQVRARKSGKEK